MASQRGTLAKSTADDSTLKIASMGLALSALLHVAFASASSLAIMILGSLLWAS